MEVEVGWLIDLVLDMLLNKDVRPCARILHFHKMHL